MTELILIRQQLGSRKRTLIIWVIVWSLFLFLFANVFNSFAKDAATNAKLFETLPDGIFKAINIDPSLYLTKVEQFISGQFSFIYMLAGSIFAFSLGVGAIGKKVEDRTIVGLLTKPIARGRLYFTQFLSNALFLAIAGTLVGSICWGIMNVVIKYQDNISGHYFFWLFVGTTLIFITLAALGQLVGMIMNGGHAVLVGAGVIVASWFLNALGDFADIPRAIQALSIYHYFNVELLRESFRVDAGLTYTLIGIMVALVAIGVFIFRKKDIYI